MMIPPNQFFYIVTSVLCLIWLIGLVAALASWKRSPRTSMLIGAALILTACSRISEAITLTINLDLQLLRKLLEMGKVGTFISRILIIGKPFGQILAWIIILIAFYIMTRKQPENES